MNRILEENKSMNNNRLKVGIILGSNRIGRVSDQVGNWVKEIADARNDADYEIVDLADYDLPFLGTTAEVSPAVIAWNEKLASLDGFVFIVQEYNHSITAVLKNALDSAKETWNNKAAGIVSYGAVGGARATEHLRGILGELKVADVRTHPALSVITDFVNMSEFKPASFHTATVTEMLDQLIPWTAGLQTLRNSIEVEVNA